MFAKVTRPPSPTAGSARKTRTERVPAAIRRQTPAPRHERDSPVTHVTRCLRPRNAMQEPVAIPQGVLRPETVQTLPARLEAIKARDVRCGFSYVLFCFNLLPFYSVGRTPGPRGAAGGGGRARGPYCSGDRRHPGKQFLSLSSAVVLSSLAHLSLCVALLAPVARRRRGRGQHAVARRLGAAFACPHHRIPPQSLRRRKRLDSGPSGEHASSYFLLAAEVITLPICFPAAKAAVVERVTAEHQLQLTAFQLQQMLCELNGGHPVDGLDGSPGGVRLAFVAGRMTLLL